MDCGLEPMPLGPLKALQRSSGALVEEAAALTFSTFWAWQTTRIVVDRAVLACSPQRVLCEVKGAGRACVWIASCILPLSKGDTLSQSFYFFKKKWINWLVRETSALPCT